MAEYLVDISLSPTAVPAGDSVEFIIRAVAGPDFPNQPTRIVYDCQGMLGTSCPNLACNEESGYVEAYVSNPDVGYAKAVWDPGKQAYGGKTTPREGQRMIVLDLEAGIQEGDVIEVHWGETLGGFGPGTKVTIVVPRPEFHAWIDVRFFSDPEAAMPDYARSYEGYDRPVPDQSQKVQYRVLPRELTRLRLIRQQDKARLIPFDRFWNAIPDTKLDQLVETEASATRNPQGIHEFADPSVQVAPKSFPLTVSPDMRDVHDGYNLYWGEIHSHSVFSIDCYTRSAQDMTPKELMTFARDRAALDFYGLTDHHVPVTGGENSLTRERWETTMDHVREMHDPGRFVVFPAFENSSRRGDTVVVFKNELTYEEIDHRHWIDLPDLWKTYAGTDFMTIPHFHGAGRLPEGIWETTLELKNEPVMEIYSDHGSYEDLDVLENGRAVCKQSRWDRTAKYFLQNGYHYGFVGDSDDHKGHLGVSGLTAVFAKELTREAIWEAYIQRRVYATTNARLRLVFTGNGHLMGAILPNERRKTLLIDVQAENTLKKIDLFRNGEPYQRFRPQGLSFRQEVVIEEDEPTNWYVRATQLDNHVAWSSPIWFEL